MFSCRNSHDLMKFQRTHVLTILFVMYFWAKRKNACNSKLLRLDEFNDLEIVFAFDGKLLGRTNPMMIESKHFTVEYFNVHPINFVFHLVDSSKECMFETHLFLWHFKYGEGITE